MITISLPEAAAIAKAANAELRTDYSGRGMYGAQCIGYDVHDMSGVMRLGVAINRLLNKDMAQDMLDRTTTDNMGLGFIVYFPGIELES